MNSLLKYIPLFVEKDHLYDAFEAIKTANNRVNATGDLLEEFVKSVISGCNPQEDEVTKIEKCSKIFSYLGNANNIPDAILKDGDAIEIKKVQSLNSDLALNSSYPKDMLRHDDTRIKNEVKQLENGAWREKNLYYIVGYISKKTNQLISLLVLDGALYAARGETYQGLANSISSTLNRSSDIQWEVTNELAKIKRVDPLDRTDLRIRGMWHIKSPFKVFGEYLDADHNLSSFYTLVSKNKYESICEEDRKAIENHPLLTVTPIKLQNPNNGANLIEAILVRKK
ncbi:MAG: NgoPII family restriction endonuclease [Alphaproteobacteria bacterium]